SRARESRRPPALGSRARGLRVATMLTLNSTSSSTQLTAAQLLELDPLAVAVFGKPVVPPRDLVDSGVAARRSGGGRERPVEPAVVVDAVVDDGRRLRIGRVAELQPVRQSTALQEDAAHHGSAPRSISSRRRARPA